MCDLAKKCSSRVGERWIGRWTWASRRIVPIAFSLLVLALGAGLASAADYYVATSGSDSNDGSIGSPFRTLEAAQTAARAAGSNAVVYVRSGTYIRTNTFKLTYQDSGDTYRAYPGETVRLSGGYPLTNWQTWQTNILCVNASTQGVSGQFLMLTFNDVRQRKAQWPNWTASDPHGKTTNSYRYVDTMASTRASLNYKAGDLPRAGSWANPALAEVFFFWSVGYNAEIVPVSSIDTSTRQILFNGTAGGGTVGGGTRYYLRNVFEELDTTNEWYLNPSTHIVYWYAPSTPGSTPAYAAMTPNLVTIGSGASNLWVHGFILSDTVGSAVVITNATNCRVTGCTLLNNGDSYTYNGYSANNGYEQVDKAGVWVQGGYANGVATNVIMYSGSDGISLSGGTVATLSASSNYAAFNTIRGNGVECKQSAGVMLRGVGNIASHNLIFDGPRWGVCGYGTYASVIEYNHIYNVCQETDDVGAIYLYREPNWLSPRGSVIRYNYVHDTPAFNGPGTDYDSDHGIYIDAMGMGCDIIGNIVANTGWNNIFINGGRDHHIRNNILIGASKWPYKLMSFNTNSSLWKATYPDMTDGWKSVYGLAAWSRMRGMNLAPTNTWTFGYVAGSNDFATNIVHYSASYFYYLQTASVASNHWDYNNIFLTTGGSKTCFNNDPGFTPYTFGTTWQATGADVNSVSVNPQFANPAISDYTVSNASVMALGWQQIPWWLIGPTNWITLPLTPPRQLRILPD